MSHPPGLGLTLLNAPAETFDYVLHLTSDDRRFVRIHCHRCVLQAYSGRFRKLTCDKNLFDLEIKVLPGYLTAMIEIIQYMYAERVCD